jgi:replicative DNA helicase
MSTEHTTEQILAERGMPAAVEAEKSILGAILLDNDMFDQAVSLDPDDFWLDGHRRLFEAMRSMREQNHPIDLITLPHRLNAEKNLEATGGAAYIASLTDGVPRRPSIAQYVKIVRDKAAARDVIVIADDAKAQALDQMDPIERVIERAEAQLFDIVQGRVDRDFLTPGEIIRESYGGTERFYNRGSKAHGLPTPHVAVNEMLVGGGLMKSDLIIVAARPSMGKTAWAMQVASNAAVQMQKHVAVFSLEMSRESLIDRMACATAEINLKDLLDGLIGRDRIGRLTKAVDALVNAPIHIDDTPGLTIGQMRAKALKLARTVGGLDLVVVDYLQLMQGTTANKRGFDNRVQEVSSISRGLKVLAKELKAPVIAVSQLSRAPEQRGKDNEPKLSDLRESGSIEQDADVVMFPHRPEYYDRENQGLKGKALMIFGKQRNGRTGRVALGFQHEYVKFVDVS